MSILDLHSVPPFGLDTEGLTDPIEVAVLRDEIRSADAVLISTPEYNRGVPGMLKNAIDWLSRPPMASVLRGKPVATIGASSGSSGTRHAQRELRAMLALLGAEVTSHPPLFVADAHLHIKGRADAKTSATLRRTLGDVLEQFVDSLISETRIYAAWPSSAAARSLLVEFEDEMAALYERPTTPCLSVPFGLTPPLGVLLLLALNGRPVGCGGLRQVAHDTTEVCKLYVQRYFRGRGYGRCLLNALELEAIRLGCRTVRLETGPFNDTARSLYASAGYQQASNGGALYRAEKRLDDAGFRFI